MFKKRGKKAQIQISRLLLIILAIIGGTLLLVSLAAIIIKLVSK